MHYHNAVSQQESRACSAIQQVNATLATYSTL
jgi:hypothetical protein